MSADNGHYHGLPIIPVPDGPPIVEGTLRTPAGDYDFCPSCGISRRVDGRGRFLPHPPAQPEGGHNDDDSECWTTGQSRADAELAEALQVGTAWESLA